jgi:hypothetical protein
VTPVLDPRAVNARLQRALADQAALADLARRAVRAAAPDPPPAGCGLAVRGTPGGLTGWFHLSDGRVLLWATDAGGTGTAAGGLLALLVKGLIPPDPSPAAVLGRVNRGLLGLQSDPPPLVGLGVIVFDPAAGTAVAGRGGVPPAVVVHADGSATVLHGPGPFLGAFAADFDEITVELEAGDRLVLATAGLADPVAVAHRHQPAGGLAYTVAAELGGGPAGCAAAAVEG